MTEDGFTVIELKNKKKDCVPRSGDEIWISSIHAFLDEFDGGISTSNRPHTTQSITWNHHWSDFMTRLYFVVIIERDNYSTTL